MIQEECRHGEQTCQYCITPKSADTRGHYIMKVNELNTVTCDCCEFSMRCLSVKRIYRTGLSLLNQQKVMANKEKVYQVRSIELENYGHVECKRCGVDHCSIACLHCGKIVNLFYGKGNIFAQFSKDKLDLTKIAAFNESCEMKKSAMCIPHVFRQVIRLKQAEEIDCESHSPHNEEGSDIKSPVDLNGVDDDDFDLMFSGTECPVIGSYTEKLMFFPEEIYA